MPILNDVQQANWDEMVRAARQRAEQLPPIPVVNLEPQVDRWIINEEADNIPIEAPPPLIQADDIGRMERALRQVRLDARERPRPLRVRLDEEGFVSKKGITKKKHLDMNARVNEAFNLRYDDGGKIPPKTLREGLFLSLLQADIPFKDHPVGVEIEVEQPRGEQHGIVGELITEAFTVHADNSLRNGAEYVTKLGILAGDAVAYMEPMEKFLNRSKFSFRCGLHVHIDVTEHSLADIYKVCLLYSVFEQMLFRISGERRANKFCVSVQDSASVVGNLMHYGHKGEWPAVADALYQGTKYAAMNIRPVTTRGSIEFRHHHGTASKEQVQQWMAFLLDIVVGAKTVNLTDLQQEILYLNTRSDYERFLKKYLPNAHKYLSKEIKVWIPMLYDGVAFVKECWAAEPEMIFNNLLRNE